MRQETKEALAVELMKATIANKDPLSIDATSAELWVQIYQESLKGNRRSY